MMRTQLSNLFGRRTERLPAIEEHPAVTNQSAFLVRKITYDELGRPQFTEQLAVRPRSAGETFFVVQTINGLPSRTYAIAIVDQPRTGPGPLAVIDERTGRGYEGGVARTSSFFATEFRSVPRKKQHSTSRWL